MKAGFSIPHQALYSLIQIAGVAYLPEHLHFVFSLVPQVQHKTALLNVLLRTWLFTFKNYAECNRILAAYKTFDAPLDETTFKYRIQGAPNSSEQMVRIKSNDSRLLNNNNTMIFSVPGMK